MKKEKKPELGIFDWLSSAFGVRPKRIGDGIDNVAFAIKNQFVADGVIVFVTDLINVALATTRAIIQTAKIFLPATHALILFHG